MARPFLVRWRDLVASSPLTTTQRAIAWRAADYANNDGTRCRPSSVRLARDCGLRAEASGARNKAVERTFAALIDCGLAEKVGGGYRGLASEYALVIPGEERGSLQTPNRNGKGVRTGRKGGPHRPPTCTQTSGGAAPDAPRRRHPFRDDGSGKSCEACSLPPGHANHNVDEEAA